MFFGELDVLFNSYIFILLFLPVTLLFYFVLNRYGKYTAASVFMLLMSLWFYAYFNISYLPLIVASIIVNYAVYRALGKLRAAFLRRIMLCAGVAFNLGLLFYYKYFDFFSENINALFSADLPLRGLILPLGISFFTFQQLSLVIDSYRADVPEYGFFDYALFVTYFPQLIAGPIVTHDELVPQFADRSKRLHNWDNLARGLYLFVLGLAKKVLVADTFGNAVNIGFADVGALSTAEALIVMVGYTLQIYFDFSGYCDMASGIARMMNIDLPENFTSPYRAHSIVEFWRRWHITLTRFFTKYIYYPLGGSRRGALRTSVNIMVVFLVSGLWHGAAWTFVLWGALHGLFNVISRLTDPVCRKIPKVIGVAFTFTLVSLLWVLFRADSISDALLFFERLFGDGSLDVSGEIAEAFVLPEIKLLLTYLPGFNPYSRYPMLIALGFFAVALFIVFVCPNARECERRFTPTLPRLALSCILLVWCVYSLSGVSTFLYFNF